MVACDLEMAPSWPAKSAAFICSAVTSVASLTIFTTFPFASFTGAYTAWIHTGLPALVRRLKTRLCASPEPSSFQNCE